MATASNPAVFAKNWRDLIRPKTLEVEKETRSTETYGKFACEPLERGFGTTLGNACAACSCRRCRARRSPRSRSTARCTSSRRCRTSSRT